MLEGAGLADSRVRAGRSPSARDRPRRPAMRGRWHRRARRETGAASRRERAGSRQPGNSTYSKRVAPYAPAPGPRSGGHDFAASARSFRSRATWGDPPGTGALAGRPPIAQRARVAKRLVVGRTQAARRPATFRGRSVRAVNARYGGSWDRILYLAARRPVLPIDDDALKVLRMTGSREPKGLCLRRPIWRVALATAVLATSALATSTTQERRGGAAPPSHNARVPAWTQSGQASWYGSLYHGRLTASGEAFDMGAMTAAHKSLPFGTWVEVENLSNRKTVRVRINDRGPSSEHRVIDLAKAAAGQLEFVEFGVVRVRVTVVPAPGELSDGGPNPQPESVPESDREAADALWARGTRAPTDTGPSSRPKGYERWSAIAAAGVLALSGPSARPGDKNPAAGRSCEAMPNGVDAPVTDDAGPTIPLAGPSRPVSAGSQAMAAMADGNGRAVLDTLQRPGVPPPQRTGFSDARGNRKWRPAALRAVRPGRILGAARDSVTPPY